MSPPCRPLPWPEAVALYRHRVEAQGLPLAPMLALVEFLASPRYARVLFACCAEDDLLRIARTPDFTAGENELRIHFDCELQRFTFTHVQRPDEPNPWSRECGPEEWRAVLERLLHKRLQWFHEG
jgi:hypothetical protein